MPREGEGAVVRQGHLIVVVVAFLIGAPFWALAVQGCARKSPRRSKDIPKPPPSKHAHQKLRSPKKLPDAQGHGPPNSRACPRGSLSPTTYPPAPTRVAYFPATINLTTWPVRTATTKYAPLAVQTGSTAGRAAT